VLDERHQRPRQRVFFLEDVHRDSIWSCFHLPVSGTLLGHWMSAKFDELLCIGLQILKNSRNLADRDPLDPHQPSGDKIRRARTILGMEYANPPPIPELARQLGLSETRLKSGFKAMHGTTLRQYCIDKRIEAARFLLKENRHTISEIGTIVGYEDHSAFTRAFRRHCGFTPREWRRSQRPRKCLTAGVGARSMPCRFCTILHRISLLSFPAVPVVSAPPYNGSRGEDSGSAITGRIEHMHTPHTLIAIAIALALLTGVIGSSRLQPRKTERRALEEVVVTAQKRTETLAEIPMSVTVVGGDALERQQRPQLPGPGRAGTRVQPCQQPAGRHANHVAWHQHRRGGIHRRRVRRRRSFRVQQRSGERSDPVR
jgi:AraC-like DNA-binding protein